MKRLPKAVDPRSELLELIKLVEQLTDRAEAALGVIDEASRLLSSAELKSRRSDAFDSPHRS